MLVHGETRPAKVDSRFDVTIGTAHIVVRGARFVKRIHGLRVDGETEAARKRLAATTGNEGRFRVPVYAHC